MFYDLKNLLQKTICDEIDKAVESADENTVLELSRMVFSMIPKKCFDFNPFIYTSFSSSKIEAVLKEDISYELNFSIIDKKSIKA